MPLKKGTIGALGGAAAGYYLWKKQPFIGAVLGFFVGRMVGAKMDKALPATTEAQPGVEEVQV